MKSKNKVSLGLAALVMALTTTSTTEAQEFSQDNPPPDFIDEPDQAVRIGILGVNVVANGIFCGVAAGIDNRNIFEDALKCMMAGSIQHVGKEIIRSNVPIFLGVGKNTVEFGTSLVNNTILGYGLFDRFHYSIGPLLLEFNTAPETQENGIVDAYWRFLPTYGLFQNFADGYEFSIRDTLLFQVPTFHMDSKLTNGLINEGRTYGNVIAFNPKSDTARPHEYTHAVQHMTYSPAEPILNRVVPITGWMHDNMHFRIGEDLTQLIIRLPSTICEMNNGTACVRNKWNWRELEAYSFGAK